MPNCVRERQNSEDALRLLRARLRIHTGVKRAQRYYFIFVFFLPIVSIVTASTPCLSGGTKWVSLVALLVGASDALWIDRWRRGRIKLSARLQEQFDTTVLDLPWNAFVAGQRVDAEEIERYGSKPLKPARELGLRNWYPQSVDPLPMSSARLVCQRTNLWYDWNLRGDYQRCLKILGWMYLTVLIVISLQKPLVDVILTMLVPFGPFALWTIRESQRQGDTIALVTRLKGEVDGSLDKFQPDDEPDKLEARARQLQDAIFSHRASSPLVSDLVYFFKRTGLEQEMEAGARDFIRRLNAGDIVK